jgi:hypothetical protein
MEWPPSKGEMPDYNWAAYVRSRIGYLLMDLGFFFSAMIDCDILLLDSLYLFI